MSMSNSRNCSMCLHCLKHRSYVCNVHVQCICVCLREYAEQRKRYIEFHLFSGDMPHILCAQSWCYQNPSKTFVWNIVNEWVNVYTNTCNMSGLNGYMHNVIWYSFWVCLVANCYCHMHSNAFSRSNTCGKHSLDLICLLSVHCVTMFSMLQTKQRFKK